LTIILARLIDSIWLAVYSAPKRSLLGSVCKPNLRQNSWISADGANGGADEEIVELELGNK